MKTKISLLNICLLFLVAERGAHGRSPISVPWNIVRHEELRSPKENFTSENITSFVRANQETNKSTIKQTLVVSETPRKFSSSSHRILHQGVNLDVTKLLDELDSVVKKLHKTIHGSSVRGPLPTSRTFADSNPRHRVSQIVGNLREVFPYLQIVRTKRESNNSSMSEDETSSDESKTNFKNQTTQDGMPEEDGHEYLQSLRYWYMVGTDWLKSWSESLSYVNERILQSNFTDEYLKLFNGYLKHFNVHIETQEEYNQAQATYARTENTTRPIRPQRKKRYISQDSFDDSSKLSYSVGSDDYTYNDPSSLKEKLRESLMRLNKIPSREKPYLEERDDGYGHASHGGYGGGQSYAHLDPYLVLAALAACVFFGVIALSLYCMLNPMACCAPAANTTASEAPSPNTPLPTTTPGLFY
ncbi:uncharacterized protein LOC108674669 [Hyalella azteca]|uniref:Uncharacterized protein LOC108674669 n=1 Tax=Hyalella azteca TaxID=294128 RepID=A0A8B7NWM3_HYAAZ|nr:uncharacterized protein LOC108674669 [Hyalella azteca]